MSFKYLFSLLLFLSTVTSAVASNRPSDETPLRNGDRFFDPQVDTDEENEEEDPKNTYITKKIAGSTISDTQEKAILNVSQALDLRSLKSFFDYLFTNKTKDWQILELIYDFEPGQIQAFAKGIRAFPGYSKKIIRDMKYFNAAQIEAIVFDLPFLVSKKGSDSDLFFLKKLRDKSPDEICKIGSKSREYVKEQSIKSSREYDHEKVIRKHDHEKVIRKHDHEKVIRKYDHEKVISSLREKELQDHFSQQRKRAETEEAERHKQDEKMEKKS